MLPSYVGNSSRIIRGNHPAFPFCRLPPIRGLGLTLGCTPFACAPSSPSVFTLALRRLVETFGLVFALGPLELVPCWLCCSAIPGACMFPCAGLPPITFSGRPRWAADGDWPMGNWPILGVRWPDCSIPCPACATAMF
jgi:hypothetical protein